MGPLQRRLALAALATVGLSACGSSSSTTTAPVPVARVGSSIITQTAFQTRLQSTLTSIQQGGGSTSNPAMQAGVRADVLRSLILDAVIAQEAAAQGLAATDAQVQQEVSTDAQQAGGLSQLQSELASAGGSLAQLQDEIRSQLNEQRLENAFASQRAAQVEQTLAGGAPFTTTAMRLSDDTGTASKGGDLGALAASDLQSDDPAFVAAVKALAVGAYTRTPVRDSGGYDIIELYGRTPATWSVRHILVAAPLPYTVQDRPTWFSEALFSAVAQDCRAGEIHVYISDAGADPCSGAPSLSPAALPTVPAG